jgi:hypothetical protein
MTSSLRADIAARKLQADTDLAEAIKDAEDEGWDGQSVEYAAKKDGESKALGWVLSLLDFHEKEYETKIRGMPKEADAQANAKGNLVLLTESLLNDLSCLNVLYDGAFENSDSESEAKRLTEAYDRLHMVVSSRGTGRKSSSLRNP